MLGFERVAVVQLARVAISATNGSPFFAKPFSARQRIVYQPGVLSAGLVERNISWVRIGIRVSLGELAIIGTRKIAKRPRVDATSTILSIHSPARGNTTQHAHLRDIYLIARTHMPSAARNAAGWSGPPHPSMGFGDVVLPLTLARC